jgi:purine-nucleoside phosphorylase
MEDPLDLADDPFAAAHTAAEALARRTKLPRHDVAVVLGSGWSPAVPELGEPRATVPMTDLPGFPTPTVLGHAGTITSTDTGKQRVLVFAGRSHLYEGHHSPTVVHGVRTAILAGCSIVILTNAAGSLRPDFPVGGPVLISDHLNLTGTSPMVGPPPPPDRPSRFVDLTDAYSARLREIAHEVEPSLPEGVYAALLGGAYETPAEIRMLRTLGADLVGMSTALETIAAVHLGAEVLGISLVTNPAAGMASEPIAHGEVLAAGAGAATSLGQLLRRIIERLP